MADPRNFTARETGIDMGKGFGSGLLTFSRDISPALAMNPTMMGTWRKREGLPIPVPDVVPDAVATAAWFAEQTGHAPKGSAEQARA